MKIRHLLIAFLCSYALGLLMFSITNQLIWHSHVSHVCEWNGPRSRGLDRGAWTHRDEGLSKNKSKAEKAARCKELGFRPKF